MYILQVLHRPLRPFFLGEEEGLLLVGLLPVGLLPEGLLLVGFLLEDLLPAGLLLEGLLLEGLLLAGLLPEGVFHLFLRRCQKVTKMFLPPKSYDAPKGVKR